MSQDRAHGPLSSPCTMGLSVFEPPSSPPGSTVIVTLSSAQSALVWGKGSCHLCPYLFHSFPELKTTCLGDGVLRGSVGRQDLGLVLGSQVLESCSKNWAGRRKTRKRLWAVCHNYVYPLLSPLLDSRTKELGETSSWGPRPFMVGVGVCAYRGSTPGRGTLNPLPQEEPHLRCWGSHGVGWRTGDFSAAVRGEDEDGQIQLRKALEGQ